MEKAPTPKPLIWIGNSRKDLRLFPDEVKLTMGFALWQAQTRGMHPDAKPLKGFGGAGILEVVDDYDGNTYRAVYTVKFAGVVYVLPPLFEINLIQQRLKRAENAYAIWKKNTIKKE